MTINKSQGHSLKKIGVYLTKSVFTHGHLYVALSRATSPKSVKILIHSDDNTRKTKQKTLFSKTLYIILITEWSNTYLPFTII